VPIHTYGNFARVSGGWDKVPDPFDPAFAEAVDGIVSNAASTYRGDPWLIGYFIDNELAWGVGNAPDPRLRYALAVETLRLGTARAKRAFIAQLSKKYREVKNLGAKWGITTDSWTKPGEINLNLPAASLARPAVIQDLQAEDPRRLAPVQVSEFTL
jgi:hypothetical protein